MEIRHVANPDEYLRPDENREKPKLSAPVEVAKESGFRKFVKTFIKSDAKDIGSYLLNDVVVPNVQRAIISSVEMLLTGNVSSRSQSYYQPSRWTSQPTGYTNYSSSRIETVRRETGPRYDDISFRTRGDAEMVLNSLYNLASNNYNRGHATIADLYSESGWDKQVPFTYSDYGWTANDLRNAVVIGISGGRYIIDLPDPVHIR